MLSRQGCALVKPYRELIKEEYDGDERSKETFPDKLCLSDDDDLNTTDIFEKTLQPSSKVTRPALPGPSSEPPPCELLESYKSLLNDVLEATPDKTKSQTYDTLSQLSDDLKGKMTGEYERLKTFPDDCLQDALAHYKDKDFQPTSKLKIVYSKQPAADTGGVLRQFYTDCFTQLLEGSDSLPALFEGKDYRKIPGVNAGFVVSGLLKFVGKIWAHCICQIGIGFSHLAPAIYSYICSGDATEANKDATIEDVVNPEVREILFL